jgi:hypothetical protein
MVLDSHLYIVHILGLLMMEEVYQEYLMEVYMVRVQQHIFMSIIQVIQQKPLSEIGLTHNMRLELL